MITPRQASIALAATDGLMAEVLARHGPVSFKARPPVSGRFQSLARAITYQQLAGAAASSIWNRVLDAAATGGRGEGRFLQPGDAERLGVSGLRSCGLSEAKALCVLDLAAGCSSGSIRMEALGRLGDEAVIEVLTSVRGIGTWTAQMFLMTALHRLDVWPVGDLGVRNGLGLILRVAGSPSVSEMEELGEPYRPYRSILASWCWREVELSRVE